MTSLILGVVCIYLAYTILKAPEDAFQQELEQITERSHTPRYYRFMRGVVWTLGITGGAIILLRFF